MLARANERTSGQQPHHLFHCYLGIVLLLLLLLLPSSPPSSSSIDFRFLSVCLTRLIPSLLLSDLAISFDAVCVFVRGAFLDKFNKWITLTHQSEWNTQRRLADTSTHSHACFICMNYDCNSVLRFGACFFVVALPRFVLFCFVFAFHLFCSSSYSHHNHYHHHHYYYCCPCSWSGVKHMMNGTNTTKHDRRMNERTKKRTMRRSTGGKNLIRSKESHSDVSVCNGFRGLLLRLIRKRKNSFEVSIKKLCVCVAVWIVVVYYLALSRTWFVEDLFFSSMARKPISNAMKQ